MMADILLSYEGSVHIKLRSRIETFPYSVEMLQCMQCCFRIKPEEEERALRCCLDRLHTVCSRSTVSFSLCVSLTVLMELFFPFFPCSVWYANHFPLSQLSDQSNFNLLLSICPQFDGDNMYMSENNQEFLSPSQVRFKPERKPGLQVFVHPYFCIWIFSSVSVK